MKRFAVFLVLWASVLAFTGCASLPGGERDEVAELLDYHAHLLAMPAKDQTRAYQEALANYERHPEDLQRLRLALVLTLPNTSWRDDARALRLIENIAATPLTVTSPRRDLALALQKLIGERLRQQREDQRLQNLVAERQRQLREEQQKVESLQDKVNSLRAIDRETNLKRRQR